MDMYGTSNSFCGSPEYMSPEMLKGQGHSKLVDFYCLGTLLYEMLTGFPPFYDKDLHKMYRKILNDRLIIADFISNPAKTLLEGLLKKDPEQRLGKDKGVIEIMNHPWLKNIDFEKYKEKLIQPPFIPDLYSSNIDKAYSELKIDPNYYTNSEAEEDDIFNSIEYNVISKINSISQHYFEESARHRTASEDPRRPRRVHRIKLEKESFKECISQYNSPAISPNHSYKASEISDYDIRTANLNSSEEFSSALNLNKFSLASALKTQKPIYGNLLQVPKDNFHAGRLRLSPFSL
jgi:serine/threonine protein kinase